MAKHGAPVRGGRSMTVLWMVLALVVVGGFLTWLGVTSEPTTVAVVEENDLDEYGVDAEGVVAVERDTLAAGTGRYVGQTVRVDGVQPTGILGNNIFWGELGDMERQVPILIRMDEAAGAQVDIRSGTPYTITGQVQRVTEQVVETWGQQGEFAGDGEQMQATFADFYIQASEVRPTRADRPAQQRE
jgi:hypothetical protein